MVRTNPLASRIRRLWPYSEAIKWLDGYASLVKAWAECDQGDLMLWLLSTQAGPPESKKRKKLVLAACDCAKMDSVHMESQRVKAYIDAARKWVAGEATVEELKKVKAAANEFGAFAADARWSASNDAAAYATHSHACATAAYAVYAAYADADIIFLAYTEYDDDATDDAAEAANTNYTAAYTAARKRILARCADIIRVHYPKPPNILRAGEHIKRLEIRSEPAVEEAARCRRQLGEAQEKMRRLSDANAALMELLSKAGRQGLNWADEVVRTLEGYEIFKAVATERAEGDDK